MISIIYYRLLRIEIELDESKITNDDGILRLSDIFPLDHSERGLFLFQFFLLISCERTMRRRDRFSRRCLAVSNEWIARRYFDIRHRFVAIRLFILVRYYDGGRINYKIQSEWNIGETHRVDV